MIMLLCSQEKLTRFIKREDADKKWYLVDAKDQVLGRLASKIATIIRGKNKPVFTPNTDTGDYVIVINAEKVKVTGKREELKLMIPLYYPTCQSEWASRREK